MKILFGILVAVSIVSLICISMIPRTVTREQVAEELDRTLEGETVIEKNQSEDDWIASSGPEPYAFGATVSRSGTLFRIYFDRKKLRFQKHPIPPGEE